MKRLVSWLLLSLVLGAALVMWLNLRDEDPVREGMPLAATPQQIAQGEYLARAGNCMGCHTARGGEPYAGGRGIETPFGIIYTSNLTPDEATGIGRWSPDHFWRAMHNGRSADGRLLYPAFPYPNYTLVTREDADAIFAYLRSLPAVAQANRPHGLSFPFNTQAALAMWRALYFKPARAQDEPAHSAEWNRGAYLVQGLGHCNACHGSRNALGATGNPLGLDGGLIPMQNWYAPSLSDPLEAGVSDWTQPEIVALLKNGINDKATVLGPMAEVVQRSTQHLSDDDLHAMAAYLRELPVTHGTPIVASTNDGSALRQVGAPIYAAHCAQCHGEGGQGVPGAYPALAGNRAVTMAITANLVRVVREGGYAPSTAGNPRPYGMPPFASSLNDREVAAVLTYVRGAWGNQGAPVSEFEVNRYR